MDSRVLKSWQEAINSLCTKCHLLWSYFWVKEVCLLTKCFVSGPDLSHIISKIITKLDLGLFPENCHVQHDKHDYHIQNRGFSLVERRNESTDCSSFANSPKPQMSFGLKLESPAIHKLIWQTVYICQGVQSSNILSFCVKKSYLSPGLFFHPDIVQPKY